jgi:hypothetical protein
MQKERRKIIYKHASGMGDSTLQVELGRALRKFKTPGDRLEPLGFDGSELRFINVARTHQKMLVGIFHKLTKGSAQIIINMDGDGEAWNVETVTAKNEKRPKGEFVEGSLFFGIWKNHILMMQTTSCRADQLQDYCTWLLSRLNDDATKPVPLVSLDNPVPASIRKKGYQQVRGIKIGGALSARPMPSSTEHSKTKAVKFTPSGDVWKGIKAIFSSNGIDLSSDIELNDALDQQNLRVSLELSCTKKGVESSAGNVLGQLGKSLSHLDNPDFSITLGDGTVVKGDELRISTDASVECIDKQPLLESVVRAMIEYMEQLIKAETVIESETFGNLR